MSLWPFRYVVWQESTQVRHSGIRWLGRSWRKRSITRKELVER